LTTRCNWRKSRQSKTRCSLIFTQSGTDGFHRNPARSSGGRCCFRPCRALDGWTSGRFNPRITRPLAWDRPGFKRLRNVPVLPHGSFDIVKHRWNRERAPSSRWCQDECVLTGIRFAAPAVVVREVRHDEHVKPATLVSARNAWYYVGSKDSLVDLA